jgi:ferritin
MSKCWSLLGLLALLGAMASSSTIPTEYGLDPRPDVKCNVHDTLPNTCQNFARFSIGRINILIREDLNTSYTFLAMNKHFTRDDVAYQGFSKLFESLAHEAKEHANLMMEYLHKRGGLMHLKPINDPKSEWKSPLEAVRDALGLIYQSQESVLDMHWSAGSKHDPHLQHFLETKRISYQVDTIQRLSEYITLMTRFQKDPLGLHILDQQLSAGSR